MAKRISAQKEVEVLEKLQSEIQEIVAAGGDDAQIEVLNRIAIGEIYTADSCISCGLSVSMLTTDGLCGYCENR